MTGCDLCGRGGLAGRFACLPPHGSDFAHLTSLKHFAALTPFRTFAPKGAKFRLLPPHGPNSRDKIPLKTANYTEEDFERGGVRYAPGCMVRTGAYIGPKTVIMNLAFVNIGAYIAGEGCMIDGCLLYTSPSPRDLSTSRMPSSA